MSLCDRATPLDFASHQHRFYGCVPWSIAWNSAPDRWRRRFGRARNIRSPWAALSVAFFAVVVVSQALSPLQTFLTPQHLQSKSSRSRRILRALATEVSGASSSIATDRGVDPHLWLEEIDSDRARAWVAEQNAETLRVLGDPQKNALFRRLLETESTDMDQDPLRKLPQVTKIGDFYYDFWSDSAFPRGVWRRTTFEEYAKPYPDWEEVLSLDMLGMEEKESWVWAGYALLDEGPDVNKTRAMVQLSRGGSDAFVAREFDLVTKRFIPPADGGFLVPEAKSTICYRDRDVLLVSTDRGPGSLTAATYPRTVVAWRRNQKLADAETIFEGKMSDWIVYPSVVRERGGHTFEIVQRLAGYSDTERRVSVDGGRTYVHLPVPSDVQLQTFGSRIVLRLGCDPFRPRDADGIERVSPFPAGSLLVADAKAALAGKTDAWKVVWEPTEDNQKDGDCRGTPRFSTLQQVVATKNCLVLVVLTRVRAHLVVFRYSEKEDIWHRISSDETSENIPTEVVSLSARAVDPLASDAIWLGRASYTQPPILHHVLDICEWIKGGQKLGGEENISGRKMKWLVPQFKADHVETMQFEAISVDGTRVPYFVVRSSVTPSGPSDVKETPVLVYAYGGFEIPVLPQYKGTVGAAWLEKGGIYVEANIRGGGEFGPEWSRVAQKGGRLRSFEDLEAVADDLVQRGLAAPGKLGLLGRSNGGLMVGNMLARPNPRFSALVGEVPLLDMRRYHLLLAGSSWSEEYGDPDIPEMWKKMRALSPYHMVDDWSENSHSDAGPHPDILFTTSTRDDRVHPGHARKMVNRLQTLPAQLRGRALLFESPEGGHAGAAGIKDRALLRTMEYDFLWRSLSSDGDLPPGREIPQRFVEQKSSKQVPEGFPEGFPKEVPQGFPEGFPEGSPVTEGFPEGSPVTQGFPEGFPEGFPSN